MKLKLIFHGAFLAFLIVCLSSCKKTDDVIFAVNSANGIGYFVNSEGKMLFGKQFDYVHVFSDGLAAVEQNDKWGFIDKTGKIIVPCSYDMGIYDYYYRRFSKGYVKVAKQGIGTGVITKENEVVIPFNDYDSIEW